MTRNFLCGRPTGFLVLLAAFVLLAQVDSSSATKERRQEGHPKVPKQHHRPTVHHSHSTHEAERDAVVEPGKKTYHPTAKATPVAPTAGYHRATLRAKAPGLHHRPMEHHMDKHAKHRMEEPKRRLEVQKPPKPFLQPPLLPKHERPPKHHVKQEKDKHH